MPKKLKITIFSKMTIDVDFIESSFNWDSFEDGKPYLGTYKQEVPGKVKMMTQSLDLKDWVKIDKTYAGQQRLKETLLEQGYQDVVFVTNTAPSTVLAKQELLELLVDNLVEYYPDKFERRPGGKVYNKMLQEEVSVSEDEEVLMRPGESEEEGKKDNDPLMKCARLTQEEEGKKDNDPLMKCARLTQEDWVIMEYDEKLDEYVLTAGVVFLSQGNGRWSLLKEKWNKPLSGIHVPVEAYEKHLAKKVGGFFKSLKSGKPMKRGNWSVKNDLNGPLDLVKSMVEVGKEVAPGRFSCTSSYKSNEEAGKKLTLRSEYQTFRRLPKSKAVVFSIRTYQFRLEEFKKFPREDTELLIAAIEDIHQDKKTDMGLEIWRNATLKYLKFGVLAEKNGVDARRGTVGLKGKYLVFLTIIALGVAIVTAMFLKYRK